MKNRHRIPQLLERLSRVIQSESYANGLNPTQWEVLRYLAKANRFSCTPRAVTAFLGTTKGTVSQTLNALERKTLITKQPDPADRRGVILALTSSGRSILADDPISRFNTATEALTDEDTAALSRSLESILNARLEMLGGRPFGICASCRYFQAHVAGGTPHRCALLHAGLSQDDSQKICFEQMAT